MAATSAIFVPFGALTGYWGMNLEDVRESKWNQADFWRFCGSVILAIAFLGILRVIIRYLFLAIEVQERKDREGPDLDTRKVKSVVRSKFSDLESGDCSD